jgi:DNA-binding MarR family transcriptional regulator
MTEPQQSTLVEETIDNLFRVSGLLDYMRLHFWDSQQLTVTQLRLLGYLRDEPGLSNADLADRLLVTRPSVSALLDRLERGGFVRREASPTDRRGIRIFLEPRGVEATAYARQDSRAFVRDMLDGLGESDLKLIAAALKKLATHGRERRAAVLSGQRGCEDLVDR